MIVVEAIIALAVSVLCLVFMFVSFKHPGRLYIGWENEDATEYKELMKPAWAICLVVAVVFAVMSALYLLYA